MPPSLRRQTATLKARETRDKKAASARTLAVEMLKRGEKNVRIRERTGVSNGTLGRLKRAVLEKNVGTLNCLLNPDDHRRGSPTQISPAAERRIVMRLKDGAKRGFAMDKDGLRLVACNVAREENAPFRNGLPSQDWIRAFRSRHRDLTFKAHELKDTTKLAAESFEHVNTLACVLEKVFDDYPNMKKDPRLIWNFDETDVSGEFGAKVKVFSEAGKHGGFRGTKGKGVGNHLTACVIANAAGDVLPPLFLFAGKNIMERWREPMNGEVWTDDLGTPDWFAKDGWLDTQGDLVLRGTPNGSMQKDCIGFVISHIQRHKKSIVPAGEKLLLLLDGHGSRKGVDWLEKARDCDIEIVQLPANTSHFLQPCDNAINKAFKVGMRSTRDRIAAKSFVDFGDMRLKLMLGIGGFRSITRDVVQRAFARTGMWPMDLGFLKRFKPVEKVSNSSSPQLCLKDVRVAVRSGASSRDICAKLDEVIAGTKKRDGHIDALFQVYESKTPSAPKERNMAVFASGVSAKYLTMSDEIRKRNSEDAKKATEKLKRERRAAEKLELNAAKKKVEEQLKRIRDEEKIERQAKRTKKCNMKQDVGTVSKTREPHDTNGITEGMAADCVEEVETMSCAEALIGMKDVSPSRVYDESVADQACLESPEFKAQYFAQFGVNPLDHN